MNKKLKHIELFAGCGGMSLGLDAAGFSLYMANELSPMAGETFAFNLLGEDLNRNAISKKKSDKVLWIKSAFSRDDLKNRLRENPFNFVNGKVSDLDSHTSFINRLVIGNIDHFLKYLANNKNICQNFRKEDIDVLSGGPPCQGFSLAGKRVKDDYKNLLPLSFAKFAGLIQPKVVILENVKGITSPFDTDDGMKQYTWLEVAKTFSIKGFVPICMLVNSKYFGVPQNRPRFILFGFRKDIFDKLHTRSNNTKETNMIFNNSLSFYSKVNLNRKNLNEISKSDLRLYDIENEPDLFNGKILPKLQTSQQGFVNASDAIGDISSTRDKYKIPELTTEYPLKLAKIFKPKRRNQFDELENHVPRNHSYKVRARFRLYQIFSKLNGSKAEAQQVISGSTHDDEIHQKVFQSFRNEKLLLNGEIETLRVIEDLQSFRIYLKEIESRKHSQRAIKDNEPAPAQMTIPDDLCHYSVNELRTLTVREMARFQSFPDWFTFRSKITTGGKQRSYETPQYTQVGNAVPPMLAFELGTTIMRLLKSIS